MCGISGAVASDFIDAEGMIQALAHRGPDCSAVFREEGVSLGHARLSILDLSSKANQPMISQNHRFVIVYNGEVYNFKVLRDELRKQRVLFKTQSDTEVILEGFSVWGAGFFEKLNGMFAIAVYDRREYKLYLARDRFGIKPLYYFLDQNFFIFGSEIKAVLKSKLIDSSLNYQALYEYLHYGTSLGEVTFYQGIMKLLPGHCLELDTKNLSVNIFTYKLNYDVEFVDDSFSTAVKKTKELLELSVQRQIISDVPVGIFLSGGIDSAAMTAFSTRYYPGKVKTYSAGFDFDKGVNELPLAAYIAKKFNTEHHELHIKGKEISNLLDSLSYYFDQPFGDAANIPLYLMSKAINGNPRVILQGDGGDELFAGYTRYCTLQHHRALKFFSKLTLPVRHFIPKHTKYYRKFRSILAIAQKDKSKVMAYLMSQEMFGNNLDKYFIGSVREELSYHNPFHRYQYFYQEFKDLDSVQRMLFTDINVILPDLYFEKVDRSTMANSLEVRVPFLDNELASYVMGLPSSFKVKGKDKKYLLKKVLSDVLPRRVLYGPKKGFSVPFGYWLKTSMKDYMTQHLCQNSLLDQKYISVLINNHCLGQQDNSFLLWKLLNFSLWLNHNKVSC